MNRFVWDMRHEGPRQAPGDDAERLIAGPSPKGPAAVPGNYTVKLEADGSTLTRKLRIVKDPRSEASDADLDEQLDLLLRLREGISETNDAIVELRQVRRQVREWVDRAEGTYWRRQGLSRGAAPSSSGSTRPGEQARRYMPARPSAANWARRSPSWPRPWPRW